ncbi:motility protein B [bacterium BMS3Bbin02]|nr:motility protein B [bacterium BMS3Bbin02]
MARKKAEPEEDNPLRWLTTYGDVVTLLMAFFVMLYAISQVDQQKFLLFVSGLQDPFGNPASVEGLLTDGNGIVGSAQSIENLDSGAFAGVALLDGLPDINEDATEQNGANKDEGAADGNNGEDEPRAIETTSELQEVRASLEEALAQAGFGDAVEFVIDERGLTIAVATDKVLFASGSSEFGDKGRDIVGVIAPTLREFSNDILVEGHTDTVPLNHEGYDNWNLSSDRALAVLKLLVNEFGIEPTRLAATGFGEFRPKADNATPEGRATNRRVELVIVAIQGSRNG